MLKSLLLSLAFIAMIPLSSFKNPITTAAVRTIIIDPGHGGSDGGAPGLITTESQICLQVALKLGAQIEREIPGIKVLYTRTTDIIPANKPNVNEGNRYRATFANSSSADLFISLHCNSAGKKPGGWYEKKIVGYDTKESFTGTGKKKRKVTSKVPVYETVYVPNNAVGTETYIWTAQENSHKEQMIAVGEFTSEGEGADFAEDDPAINALKMLYTKKYFVKSLRLAEFVQAEFQNANRINRGVKQRNDKGIWVLHATGMPSILVEMGFISNKEEEEYMMSEHGQAEISNNITTALKKYISQNPDHKSIPAGLPK